MHAGCGRHVVGWWWRLFALGAFALVVAGASPASADVVRPQQSVAVAEPTAVILLTEYALGPADVSVPPGEVTLRLVNAGIRRHTLTVLIDGVEHVSPEVRPGDTADWLLVLPRAGEYLLWCSEYRHLEKGMGGKIVAG